MSRQLFPLTSAAPLPGLGAPFSLRSSSYQRPKITHVEFSLSTENDSISATGYVTYHPSPCIETQTRTTQTLRKGCTDTKLVHR